MARKPWWLRRAKGDIRVDLNYDRPTGVRCPTNCGNIVVYNGNYFCECGWALADIRENKWPSHPGFTEFIEALRVAGWWDAYYDKDAANIRRENLRRLGYTKRIIDRAV